MAAINQRLLQPGERIRVMVVDDSVVIRRLVTQALEGDPLIEVVGTASNGAIGLQRIPQFNPDVITLDIEMPDMNGLEMLKRVRRDYRQPRLSTGFDVEFVVDGKAIRGLCRDASHAGIRAEFEGPISVGSSGLLILRHPIGVLKLDAQVAYNEEHQAGLIFRFETSWEQRMTMEFIASITNPNSNPLVV